MLLCCKDRDAAYIQAYSHLCGSHCSYYWAV